MAGTDHTRDGADPAVMAPVMILVEPQLGENIGMAARAMLNCGLTEMRLVNPRDDWPNRFARAAASGADDVIDNAQVYASTADAIADLQYLYAATARPRDMTMDVVTPRQAARRLHDAAVEGTRSGVLFGKEAKGLTNDDVSLADAVLTVPLNPAFTSLNLAQAVFCVGYEWLTFDDTTAANELAIPKETRLATKQEFDGFIGQVDEGLEAGGFYHVREKKPIMARNIRNVLQRARFTEQEIRTFRGVITALTRNRQRD